MARPKTVTGHLISFEVTINPASLATHVSLDQTATVKGLRKHIPVQLWAEALEAGMVISNVHCSALDTLKFRLTNSTASTVDCASQTFRGVQR